MRRFRGERWNRSYLPPKKSNDLVGQKEKIQQSTHAADAPSSKRSSRKRKRGLHRRSAEGYEKYLLCEAVTKNARRPHSGNDGGLGRAKILHEEGKAG